MKMMFHRSLRCLPLFLLLSVSSLFVLSAMLSACAPSVSLYDHYAYTQATGLKVDALDLMDKAVDSASVYRAEIESLRLKVEKMVEYEQGRPNNDLSAEMWRTLKSPDRKLLGGFLLRWREKGRLSRAFITEAKALIAEAFDLIIGLESGKIPAKDAKDQFLKLD